MSSLDRTRYIFIGIIGIALLAIIVVSITGEPDPTLTPFSSPETTHPTGDDVVGISVLTSDTKAEWMERVTESFNAAGFQTDSGKTIFAEVMEEGSPGDAQQAVLDGEIKPVVWI